MKIIHLKRYFVGIAMTAFLALLAGNAFGNAIANSTNSVSPVTPIPIIIAR